MRWHQMVLFTIVTPCLVTRMAGQALAPKTNKRFGSIVVGKRPCGTAYHALFL